MSSLSGLIGSKLNTAYVASKHALVGLAKALAQDHGKDGIVTVALCPGYVETEMTERSIRKRMEMYGLSREDALAKIVRTNPQQRIIPAEEVAEMVAFICSGKVPSLSGAAIALTGGA
jgi:NAD(P)-dependent dehydrogenase (short-subunit alcohol dehydrogenase family)